MPLSNTPYRNPLKQQPVSAGPAKWSLAYASGWDTAICRPRKYSHSTTFALLSDTESSKL